jgi:uncharacterized protein YcbK (DUF882 family)
LKQPTAAQSIGPVLWLAVVLALAGVFILNGNSAESREPDRVLKLYFGHTQERGEFLYKRNGRYDPAGLAAINRFLRDWRREQTTQMDPALLDILWEIYEETGSNEYIHIVSAYRSPATNAALRASSSGVAENSQHMLGKAIDFYIPGVPLERLRALAMRRQGGGVGYYPASGSPFVHIDTGSVRAWPRMSREQLIALFPNGETVHLPPDGKPLAGYQVALARQRAGEAPTPAAPARPAAPAAPPAAAPVAVASLEPTPDMAAEADERRNVAGWLRRVFRGGGEAPATPGAPEALPADTAPIATGAPQVLVASLEAEGPRVPRLRPGAEPAPAEGALLAAAPLPEATLTFAPLPRVRPEPAALAETLFASADTPPPLALGAEDAIAALTARIERETPPPPAAATAPAPAPTPPNAIGERVALAFQAEPALPSAAESAIIAALSVMSAAPAPTVAAAAPTTPPPTPSAASDTSAVVRPIALAALVPLPSAPAFPPAENGIVLGPDLDAPLASASAAPPAAAPTMTVAQGELAMPDPAGAPGFFTAPASAALVGAGAEPQLPASGFSAAAGEQAPGLLSRLIASLIR